MPELGRRFGVSSTAVAIRCKKRGIKTPVPGFWNGRASGRFDARGRFRNQIVWCGCGCGEVMKGRSGYRLQEAGLVELTVAPGLSDWRRLRKSPTQSKET